MRRASVAAEMLIALLLIGQVVTPGGSAEQPTAERKPNWERVWSRPPNDATIRGLMGAVDAKRRLEAYAGNVASSSLRRCSRADGRDRTGLRRPWAPPDRSASAGSFRDGTWPSGTS